MKTKNKKGSVFFNVLLVVLVFIILISTFINRLKDVNDLQEQPIGSKQMEILLAEQRGESTIFFLSQFAKYQMPDIIEDVGFNGGFYGNSPCGRSGLFNLWNNQNSYCFPDYQESMSKFLNLEMNSIIESYPLRYSFADNNYEVALIQGGTKAVAIAKDKLIIPLTEGRGYYTILPSFEIPLKKNPVAFVSLFTEAQELVTACQNQEATCVSTSKPSDWTISSSQDSNYAFQVTRNGITVRFALFIPYS